MYKVLILVFSAILSGCIDGGLHIYPIHYRPADKVCGEGRYQSIVVYVERVVITCKGGAKYIYLPQKRNRK